MRRAYRFRIYPNHDQQVLFGKTFGCCRFIYNRMLSDKKDWYEKHHEMLRTTPAQYKKEYEWLKEVDSLALANVQQPIESSFGRKRLAFPDTKRSDITDRAIPPTWSTTTSAWKGNGFACQKQEK